MIWVFLSKNFNVIKTFFNVFTSPLSERLKVTSPDVKREQTHHHHHHELSPAERRAIEAEKRKQWRQARYEKLNFCSDLFFYTIFVMYGCCSKGGI